MRLAASSIAWAVPLAGCAAAEAPPAHPQAEVAGEPCLDGFRPSGSAPADVIRLSRRCGRAAGLHALSPMRRAHQREREAAHRLALPVGRGEQCLRVFAAGGRGVIDLDVMVTTAQGEPIAGDVSSDNWPVVPPRAELCLLGPELYVLEVAVTRGEGEYALQVWGR